MDRNIPRSIYCVALMCSTAAAQGLPLAACLEGSGIAAAAVDDPATEIYFEQELVVAANLVRHLGHVPGLGLLIGRRLHIAAWGTLAFMLASCATVRDLTQLGPRYDGLAFSFTDKRYLETSGEFRLVLEDAHIPAPLQRFALERDLAGLYNVTIELFSQALPIRACRLRCAQPPYAELYQQQFGVMPEFGAPENVVILDGRMLDWPLPQADPHALRFWDAHIRALLARKRSREGVAGRVRTLLSKPQRRMPGMDEVAAALATTPRNLRRLLAAEGTRFRALSDEVSQTIAEELLSSGHTTVEEVAVRLGYNEVSSFSNAFRRWTGRSPRQWSQAAGSLRPPRLQRDA